MFRAVETLGQHGKPGTGLVYGQAVKGEARAGPRSAVVSQCIRRTGFTLKDKLLLWYCSRGISCRVL